MKAKGFIECSFDAVFQLECVRDAEGKIVDFCYMNLNSKAEEFSGLKKNQLVGQRIGEIFPWVIPQGFIDEFSRAVQTQQSSERKFEFHSPDGKKFWIHHQIVPIENVIWVTTRNINLEKLTEEKLKRSHDILLETHRLTGMASYEICLKTGKREWSSNAPQLYGVAEDVSMDEADWDALIHPEDRLHVKEVWEKYLKDGLDFTMHYRIRKSDGSVRWMQGLGKTLFDSEGNATRAHGCLQDITEKKLQEELLELQQRKLLQSSRLAALGEMAAGIAHEINNPLSVVIARASLLGKAIASGNATTEKLVAGCTEIKDLGFRISKIISGLKAFGRVADNDPILKENLMAIAEEAIELCRTQYQINHVRIDFEAPSEDAFVFCRRGQVLQILLNLLSNALDAIKGLENKWVRISIRNEGNQWILSVTDSGKIESPEVSERLMEPFFTTKEIGKGMGLGLSISKGLAEGQGGQLAYRSDLPSTQFDLSLVTDLT